MKEILKAVVFCHRVVDDKDFTEQIICIPSEQSKVLEQELIQRQRSGELDVVQIGRVYIQATPFTDYFDEVQDFLDKIDEVRLHSSTERVTPSEGDSMKTNDKVVHKDNSWTGIVLEVGILGGQPSAHVKWDHIPTSVNHLQSELEVINIHP